MASLPPAPDPLHLPKFALWCFQRGLKLAEIAEALDCSHETARRLQMPFGEKRRCIPKQDLMNRLVHWTGGEIQPADFYPTPSQAAAMVREAVQ